jgi:hypothetical protein
MPKQREGLLIDAVERSDRGGVSARDLLEVRGYVHLD